MELKNADKINIGAKCLKLFLSAATPDFVHKSIQFFETFEAKLRTYGLDSLMALLLTRRLLVIADHGSRSLDVSRIVSMLRAASRPRAVVFVALVALRFRLVVQLHLLFFYACVTCLVAFFLF
jgi:hypothetical protein